MATVVCWLTLTLAAGVLSLEFSPPLTDQYVLTGSPFWWTCSVNKTSAPGGVSYSWRFQDGDVSSDQNFLVFTNGTLHIRQVQQAQMGQYSCLANTGTSYIITTAWLRAAYINLTTLTLTSNNRTDLSNTLELGCRVDARPAPSFTWIKDGTGLAFSAGVKAVEMDFGYNILMIDKLSYADSGNYTCNVSHITLTQPISTSTVSVRVLGPPVITSPPADQIVPVSYNVTFKCPVTSDPKAQNLWRFQSPAASDPVPFSSPTSSASVDTDTGSLTLYNVSTDSIGTYVCEWSNIRGMTSVSVSLRVEGKPLFPTLIVLPTPATLNEGDRLTLNCKGDGNPKPIVIWSFPDGQSLTSDGRAVSGNSSVLDRAALYDNGTLAVNNVTRLDRGMYYCRLKSQEGEVTTSAFVNVQFSPLFLVSPQNTEVREGSELRLACTASGNPNPNITWSLPDSLNISQYTSDGFSNEVLLNNGTLLVRKTNRTHEGQFTCIAANTVGSAQASAYVSISGLPYFIASPTTQGTIEGDTVVLKCEVGSNPQASVSWYFRYFVDLAIQAMDLVKVWRSLITDRGPTDNMTLVTFSPDSRFSLINKTSLQIANIRENYAGLYTCYATNSIGSSFELAIVRVITFPKFDISPVNQTVMLGGSASLECYSVGIPVPSQRWLFNRAKLQYPTSRISVDANGTIEIKDIGTSDIGEYTCLATNQAGQASVSAYLVLSSLPYVIEAPSNLTVSELSNATLRCRGNSTSPFEISWYKSTSLGVQFLGQIILDRRTNVPNVTSQISRIQILSSGDLYFTCVDRQDASWYFCSLNNPDGNSTSSPAYMDVNFLPSNLTIETPVSADSTQPATLSCRAWGSPLPNISWITPLKVELSPPGGSGLLIISDQNAGYVTSKVFINTLNVGQHGGLWICKACNLIGCRVENTSLNINYANPYVRAVVSQDYENEVSVECVTTGMPYSTVTYSSNGVDVLSMEGHRVINNIMYVIKTKIQNEYTCTARNDFGQIGLSLVVPPLVVISRLVPKSSSILVTSDTKLPIQGLMPDRMLVQWSSQNSADVGNQTFYFSGTVDDYLLAERGVVRDPAYAVSCAGASTGAVPGAAAAASNDVSVSIVSDGLAYAYHIEANVQNLRPNTMYNIRASLLNALWPGPLSTPSSVTTLAAAPAAVTNVTVAVANRSVSVTWNNPDPLNGRPEDTVITVVLQDAGSNPIKEAMVGVLSSPSASFSGLNLGMYSIQIFAYNKQTNTKSDVVTVSFQVRDQPPRVIPVINGLRAVNANSAQVNWTLPTDSTLLTPGVTGFKISVNLLDGSQNQRIVEVPSANASAWVVENLQEHKKYMLCVAAQNSAGVGPYSECKNVTTPYSEFSTDALEDTKISYSISWKLLAIILICICAALIALTAAVVVSHQIKLSKRKSVDLKQRAGARNGGRDSPQSSPEASRFQPSSPESRQARSPARRLQESPQAERVRASPRRYTRELESHENQGFVMY
ncbi:neural cell adhesion molecule L1-like [Physella acuta]|uniref:neural cell adhesion molecule L1-like n=1 Tax=Physella acuta TaxID=109671 RepID=UPI0027DB61FC|nr:neural cell adhesion molecule L1-like [Physella acuta]XP_059179646.1 neural cell adhesion molecule L1-like [Physella acuta]